MNKLRVQSDGNPLSRLPAFRSEPWMQLPCGRVLAMNDVIRKTHGSQLTWEEWTEKANAMAAEFFKARASRRP